MDTFVFFTKGRPPTRIIADNELVACEKFYAQHPDFHLSELLDIRIAKTKSARATFGDNRIVKW